MAAYAIQFRRGTTTEHASFTGLLGEVTVDTDKKTVVVHDGSTAGGTALALDGAAISTTTGTFSSNVTIAGTLAVTSTSTMGGNLTMTGHILPSADVTYDLGSASKQWKDIYVGPGSLYVNGTKVIEDDSGTINITTDTNEDLKLTTTGTGTLKFISANGINLTGELGAVSGDLQIGDHIDMNSSLIKELGAPVSGTDAATKTYVDTTSASAVTGGANAGSFTTLASSGNATIGGNLTVSGTTTYIETEAITLADNIFIINSNATGVPSENGGFEVERGDSLNVQFLWNEGDDRWSVGAQNFHSGANIAAATLTGDLTGDVTGDLTGDVTGDVTGDLIGNSAGVHTGNVTGDLTGNSAGVHTGNVTGNVTGNTSGSAGTVTSIAAHIKDEDDMSSDSATHVASQQSVKAYVTSQIATKDNTDEMTEGSTNLYYTDARSRAAISVSGDMSYNSSTGVISTTGLASSDTDDLAEGSSNLYYTDARVDAYVNASILTTDVSEGTNLYYTDARADARTAISTAANTTAWEAYADQAEVDAESAAAADATTKADAALAAAVAADAVVTTAFGSADTVVTNAYIAADAVVTTAFGSADTVVTNAYIAADAAVTTAMQTYADTAETDAIASAESKDAVRATAANAYADAAVAAIVDGAPGTLDTLNELAAAIADDASYSTTLTTLVGTKLALAGGAMTGAITTNSTFDGRDVATDGSKLDGIEASADVTDTANVTSAGALMDSEMTGIAHVKSLNQALTTTSSPSFTAVTATDFNGTATYALYADLAERYAADAPYEEGTVVMFGGEAEVTSAQGYGSTKIAGVVSTNPGFAMNAEAGNSETHPYIALQGRVPCKVMGTVSKGDIIVASEVSGIATAWLESTVDPRMTAYVGIAIEDKTTDAVGYIEVKVGK